MLLIFNDESKKFLLRYTYMFTRFKSIYLWQNHTFTFS